MKKLIPLLVLASTCLCSCGEDSIYGKYKFLLGRQGDYETRVSVEMELKDEVSTVDKDCKNFNARFEMSGLAGNSKETTSDTTAMIGLVTTLLTMNDGGVFDPTKPLELPGYYKVLDLKDPKYGNKVSISFDLGENINQLIKDLFQLNPSDVISNFVVSYCNGSSFTFQLPVSLDDIQMQLAWYGTYIDYDPYVKDKVNSINDLVNLVLSGKLDLSSVKTYNLKNFFDGKLPGEQDSEKRYGTHPSIELNDKDEIVKDEILDMNEKYQGLFSNTFVYNYDTEGDLVKIGTIYEELNEAGHYYFFPLNGFDCSSVNTFDAIMKKDVGVFEYDFSEETEVTLTVTHPAYEDGSYQCNVNYKNPTEVAWDWKSFYKKPFEFRDFHDIKIELKKE